MNENWFPYYNNFKVKLILHTIVPTAVCGRDLIIQTGLKKNRKYKLVYVNDLSMFLEKLGDGSSLNSYRSLDPA